MRRKPERGLFVTGTDTGVGKTHVAAGIAHVLHRRGYQVGVFKPVASGCRRKGRRIIADDAVKLWEAAGRPQKLDEVCPFAFEAPLAPHLAAQAAGQRLEFSSMVRAIEAWGECDVVIVEGIGGLMSPLGPDTYVADLVYEFRFPLVVVANNGLGVINQTLQALLTASSFRGGLAVAGVVLNDARPPHVDDPSRDSNRVELARRCVPPILAHVRWQETRSLERVDWNSVACAGAMARRRMHVVDPSRRMRPA